MSATTDLLLRDVLDIPAPEDVHAGDFKVELSSGFEQTAARVEEYVVTKRLAEQYTKALNVVRTAVRDNTCEAAYLHGSFGAGKSHFMTVLHAVLNRDPAALAKPRLREVAAEHDPMLRERRFLMVPYHLVGAADLDSALLGGYVRAVLRLHPDAPHPPVYRDDAMLADARRNRSFEGDALFIRKLNHSGATPSSGSPSMAGLPELPVLPAADGTVPPSGWTSELLDEAFAATSGDRKREALVQALLSGPMQSYSRGATGDSAAFLPLEDGLSITSRHAKDLGYDGIILFIDELILWLQAHLSDRDFVNDEVGKLVKLVESGAADRPVPIVSFVSRQRHLSLLVGDDTTGSDVQNLKDQVTYLEERFGNIDLQDSNLPEIITERVLKPRPGAREAIDSAFARVEKASADTRDSLLDAKGATGANWADFKAVYPLTPALLNVLVVISGALQRERSGLKLVYDLLGRNRGSLTIGQVIPLGDLWDVLSGHTSGAFTERLKREGEQAERFYRKASSHLLAKYGSADDRDYLGDLRLVKTLLLAYLAPDVSAFARLTGRRLAALNHGSIQRTRARDDARVATQRLLELQAEFGELRSEGEEDPVFALHLSDLDAEPLLEAVGEVDKIGARRLWVKEALWQEFGIEDTGSYLCERGVVWRGTKRTAEFVFGNVRDAKEVPENQFEPSVPGNIRFVVDYPFDPDGHPPSYDARRIIELRRDPRNQHPTLVWLPAHLSPQRSKLLGRLIRMNYLLERNRLDDLASTWDSGDRERLRIQLRAQRDNIDTQLRAVLRQAYGIANPDEGNFATLAPDDGPMMSMLPAYTSKNPEGGTGFELAMLRLSDGLFGHLHPKHPDFDPQQDRKPVTAKDLRTVYGWIADAMKDGSGRTVVDRAQLPLVKRIVHPLELGEVYDGPLVLGREWKSRIDAHARQKGASQEELPVARIREWFADMGWNGMDSNVADLVIATYALLADRTWVLHNAVQSDAPEIGKIGSGYTLRAQERPSQAEFEAALGRAGALFGIAGIPRVLFARNIAKLAGDVRDKARELESAVNGVHDSLQKPVHAAALGVDSEPAAPRLRGARYAADLVERLLRCTEDTPLIRQLASLAYDIGDEELGTAIGSAPDVVDALDSADWQTLQQVHHLAARDDTVGDRAQRVVADLTRAAQEPQRTHDLVAPLTEAHSRTRELISEALRLADLSNTSPDEPVHPTPPASGNLERQPSRGGAVRRITAGSAMEQELAALTAEISAFGREHPDIAVEVSWQPVGGEEGQGA